MHNGDDIARNGKTAKGNMRAVGDAPHHFGRGPDFCGSYFFRHEKSLTPTRPLLPGAALEASLLEAKAASGKMAAMCDFLE
jgi:hypothetical protein